MKPVRLTIFLIGASLLSCSSGTKRPSLRQPNSSNANRPDAATAKTEQGDSKATNKVTLVSQVNWDMLNPAKGDKSPKAATLWGDRNAEVPTGFLVKFVDGFSSPPHVHNVSYRGIVISGLVHNDDPSADEVWLPQSSYWTQPAGDVHITSAKGQRNVALIEISKGPYLVKPVEQAFDNGESMVRVSSSDILWVADSRAPGVSSAQLWDSSADGTLKGRLVKLDEGFAGDFSSDGEVFQAVVIQGAVQYEMPDGTRTELVPGSMFSSTGKSVHHLRKCVGSTCIVYLRASQPIAISGVE